MLLLPNIEQLCSAGAYQKHYPAHFNLSGKDKTSINLLDAVDGLHVEKPFYVHTPRGISCRRTLPRVLNELSIYKKLLAQKKAVFWLDYQAFFGAKDAKTGDNITIYDSRPFFQTWLAALAMVVRDPGDPLFVVRHNFQGRLRWDTWPKEYGSSTRIDARPMILPEPIACEIGNASFPCPSLTSEVPPGDSIPFSFSKGNIPDSWSIGRNFVGKKGYIDNKVIIVQSVTKLHPTKTIDLKNPGVRKFSIDLGFSKNLSQMGNIIKSEIFTKPKYGKATLIGKKIQFQFDPNKMKYLALTKSLPYLMDGLSVRIQFFPKEPHLIQSGFSWSMSSWHPTTVEIHILITYNSHYTYTNIATNLR